MPAPHGTRGEFSVAERERDINASALGVFGNLRELGSGPSLVQNNYMLHPSDPSVLRTIGDASVAGISMQPTVRDPRVKSGL